ncbi:DUF6678 family protein [uncultured Pontibacter sp.]|uniref:DUF6678 family protein n=1 Tax=uncultured Pontibacter sp. TaxID=453356 RepID=UPI0034543840
MIKPYEGLSHILDEKRLVPIMNNTKWQELISAMRSLPQIEPHVRIKYLHDDVAPKHYAPIWWEQLEQTGLANIEWLEIKAMKESSTGLLAPTLQADYTDLFQEVLDKYGIPHEVEGEIFRIMGYQQLQ